MSKSSTRHFFTPVSNEVFLDRRLTRRARQILLVLEVRAGASRIVKLTQKQIAEITGYPLRSVKYALGSLRRSGWIEQRSDGEIGLVRPIPGKNFVQVYEAVVYRQDWQDWQKHLLLFVMSQFRGSEQDFGVPLYSLNMRGRVGPSIEKHCRVPGTVKERRRKVRKFLKQLETEGILRVVEPATSNRPAICMISREALEQMEPRGYQNSTTDPEDRVARLRFAPSSPEMRGKPKPSSRANRYLAGGKPKPSNRANRNLAKGQTVTNVKEPEESEESKKIPEPPVPPSAARGAISSPNNRRTSDSDSAFEDEGEFLPVGDDLASLLKSEYHRKLTNLVEQHCSGMSLMPSRENRESLAGKWQVLLEELPADLNHDDVINAITSEHFEGLNSRSWGLLLSKNYLNRFFVEIQKHYECRKQLAKEASDSLELACRRLHDPDPAYRKQAIEVLAARAEAKKAVPLLLAGVLVGKKRDQESSVRLEAAKQLIRLVVLNRISNDMLRPIRARLPRMLRDDDPQVRDELEYLQQTISERD